MRFVLLASALLIGQMSLAEVSVPKDSPKYGPFKITVTGSEAQLLKKIVLNYENKMDGVLAEPATLNKADNSLLQSIQCAAAICEITYRGEIKTSADQQDYYNDEFNNELKSLAADEVVITSGLGKEPSSSAYYEARILRLLMESSREMKEIEVTTFKTSDLKNAEQWGVSLYELSLKMNDLTLTCHSTLDVQMGNYNRLIDGCYLQGKAKLK